MRGNRKNLEDSLRALRGAARSGSLDVVGHEGLRDVAVAHCAAGLAQAFGQDPGFLYIEAHTAAGSKRPADLVLCTPSVGLLSFEVKAFPIDKIDGVRSGVINVRYKGNSKEHDVIDQARSAMFAIQKAVLSKLSRSKKPFMDWLVAFPNIRASEWEGEGYSRCVDMQKMLLDDDLGDTKQLRKRLIELHKQEPTFKGRGAMPDRGAIEQIRIVFGDSSALKDHFHRSAPLEPRTLGDRIDLEATREKVLSAEQQRLSRLDLTGASYLVRGVAGSGKSVVLANNVARLVRDRETLQQDLFEEPRALRIGVVCFNRALVPFLREKMSLAYSQFTGERLALDRVEVRHFNGFLKVRGQEIGGLEYVPISGEYKDRQVRATRYLEQIRSLEESGVLAQYQYDVIYVDEAQDLHPDEFRVLLKFLRPSGDQRNLVVFYDDAQNIYGLPRPTWSDLGIDVVGRSFVMKECFRNSCEIIQLAFNVLLGSKADTARVGTRIFADAAELERQGLVTRTDAGCYRTHFAERCGEKPRVHRFPSREEEVAWLIDEVRRLVEKEHVRPHDILIMYGTHDVGHLLEEALRQCSKRIRGVSQPHIEKNDEFILREGQITSTTVYNAKGYDAPIGFLVGVDTFTPDAKGRARFYIGCTRTKHLLYVTGIEATGEGPAALLDEAHRLAARQR
jgi:hypothetical protein